LLASLIQINIENNKKPADSNDFYIETKLTKQIRNTRTKTTPKFHNP